MEKIEEGLLDYCEYYGLRNAKELGSESWWKSKDAS